MGNALVVCGTTENLNPVAESMWLLGRLRSLCGGWVSCGVYVVGGSVAEPMWWMENLKIQAGTELCQAQSKLIQIGRFFGQIYIFVRKVFFGS